MNVPNNPIIPFIEGDGIGPDIWANASRVLEELKKLMMVRRKSFGKKCLQGKSIQPNRRVVTGRNFKLNS